MNCEELLLENVNENDTTNVSTESVDSDKLERRRERLAAISIGGQSKQYFGKTVSAEDIDNMKPQEINKLYTRYEARLGASMTKTLGQAAIQLYATFAGRFLPIPVEKQHFLACDLEADPFVSHAMTTAACELYYRYGFYMAPLTAAMTTMKYCQFGHKEVIENIDGNESDESTNVETPVSTSVDQVPQTEMKKVTAEMQVQNESSVKKVTKNPKKQAAGRAGAAARKANKERILKELQTAKKDLRKQDIVEKTEIPKTSSPPKTNQSNSFGISIPVCVISAGVVSAGIYYYIQKNKSETQKVVVQQPKEFMVKQDTSVSINSQKSTVYGVTY